MAFNPSPAIKGLSGLNETFFKAATTADGLNEMSPRVIFSSTAFKLKTKDNELFVSLIENKVYQCVCIYACMSVCE